MGRPVVGETVSGFELSNQFGEPIQLSTPGGVATAIVFFPFAFSSVCAGELAELQHNRHVFDEAGVRILAVSTDHKYALRSFADAEGLNFDLLSDFWPHGRVSRQFGVFDDEHGFAGRGTFFIDGLGVVRSVVSSGRGEAREFGKYLDALESLRAEVPG
ncbi:redoxin domain-containing protein [Arthrobacter roseus]|uniref:redoxin domain-containing protein n=1 Tax=Arthrobacter roseus TaxID=136274 RepID=UPI0019650645|nr:redoxin domain-containing protein [Arthrobacter roseus]MBM7848831.1 peroxiredoxin [Arthrobacter roseus]